LATERLHVTVSGDVQGVGFRDFVRRRAAELGLSGWVKNLPDGRVEAVAEGNRADLERMLDLLRRGPSMAEVGQVRADWETAQGGLRGFQIAF
jgi:acylphosphatase